MPDERLPRIRRVHPEQPGDVVVFEEGGLDRPSLAEPLLHRGAAEDVLRSFAPKEPGEECLDATLVLSLVRARALVQARGSAGGNPVSPGGALLAIPGNDLLQLWQQLRLELAAEPVE